MKRLCGLFIGWNMLLFLFAFFTEKFIPLSTQSIGRGLSPSYFHWIWANFDGVHYIVTATSGYQNPNFAFFPLYPLLISVAYKTLHVLPVEAGILISQISFFCSLIVLSKIVLLDFNKSIETKTLLLLLLFPLSFFYHAVYTDALFLFFSTASFYAARKSHWFLAGALGFFTGLTRLVGIVLAPVLVIEWYLQNKLKGGSVSNLARSFFTQHAYWILLVPVGLITYGFYLQSAFGDFLLFQKSMHHWGQGEMVFPLQVVYRYLKILLTTPVNFVYSVALLELIATFLYFSLSIYVLRKIRLSYGVFMLLVLLIPTFTGTFQGMPRYLLHLFPGFIGLALLASSKTILWGVIIVFILLQFVFVGLFTRGYFIA